MDRVSLLLVPCLALLGLTACSPKLIPGTLIEDTDEARQLIDVMGAYTDALEKRDVDRLLGLTSGDFFETSGTPEGDDDFDRSQLEGKLRNWFEHFKTVRVRLEVKKIAYERTVDDKIERARVAYFYDINFQVPEGNGSEKLIWRNESDTKEMVLRLEEGRWKILSGL